MPPPASRFHDGLRRRASEASSSRGDGGRSSRRRRTPSVAVLVAWTIATAVRLALLFGDGHPSPPPPPPALSVLRPVVAALRPWRNAVRAAVSDDRTTLRHAHEGRFLLRHGGGGYGVDGDEDGGGTLDDVYRAGGKGGGRRSYVELTPLHMVVLDTILTLAERVVGGPQYSSTSSSSNTRRDVEVVFGVLLLLIDLAVAKCLHDVAFRSLLREVTDRREVGLEKCMDEYIKPMRGWVFGLPQGRRREKKQKKERGDGKGKVDGDAAASSKAKEDVSGDENGDAQKSLKEEKEKADKDAGLASGEDATAAPTTPAPVREPMVTIPRLPVVAATLYYCNPVVVLASSDHLSFQNAHALFWLMSFRSALAAHHGQGDGGGRARPDVPAATFWLALATYVDVWPAACLVPLICWSMPRSASSTGGDSLADSAGALVFRAVLRDYGTPKIIAGCVFFYALWLWCLVALSSSLVGPDAWPSAVAASYGRAMGYSDNLSPNLGMHWYFFVQMFARFRRYFVILLAGLPCVYVAPLSIRLRGYPMALATAFMFLWTIHKPAPTLFDASLALILVLMSPRTVARMGNASLISLVALIVPLTLFVVFHWMWLETGSGNANYMFFQCLAFNVFLSVIFLDFVSSTVKRDKALRLTAKHSVSKQEHPH